jgi:hypothetical protein
MPWLGHVVVPVVPTSTRWIEYSNGATDQQFARHQCCHGTVPWSTRAEAAWHCELVAMVPCETTLDAIPSGDGTVLYCPDPPSLRD